MKVVLHQIAKDLHYIRRPLAAWLVLLLGSAAARFVQLDLLLYPIGWAEKALSTLSTLGPGITVLGWFLTVRVVHADPVDGTTAFWLTRPISRRALWLSKLLLVGALFVLLPAATTGLVVVSVAGAGTVLRAVTEQALLDAVFVLAAVWLAALTRDVARLVIGGVAGWIAWGVVRVRLLDAGTMAWTELQPTLIASSGVLVAGLVFFFVALAAGRFLYLTRRRAPAVAAGAVLVLASPFLAAAWPWNVLSSPRPPSASPLDPDRISLAITPPSPPKDRRPARSRFVEASLRIAGGPDGWVIVPVRVASTWRLADGTTHRYDEPTPESQAIGYGFSPLVRWATAGISHLVGARLGITPWTARSTPAEAGATTRLTEVPAGGSLPFKGDLAAAVTCAAFRGAVEATLPLTPGSEGRANDATVHVLGARAARRESWADVFVVDTRSVTLQLLLPRLEKSLLRILRNRRRTEWLPDLGRRRTHIFSGSPFAPTLVRYEATEFVREASAGTPDDEWLRGAELVMVSFEQMGTFTKTVRIPDFEIPPVDSRTRRTGGAERPD